MTTAKWLWTIIPLILLIGLYIYAYRKMKKQKEEFDAQYNAYKEIKEIFVLGKKVTRQPVRPEGLYRFLKVKTYQVVGRLTVSQSIKGMNRSMMTTLTFNLDKKEFKKIEANRRYKVELAGNYIGKVFAPPPDKKDKKKEEKKRDHKQDKGKKR